MAVAVAAVDTVAAVAAVAAVVASKDAYLSQCDQAVGSF
jgi:hypothetical protein